METIKQILRILPSSPGVYQFKDKDGKIIYIGKARNLKNRVGSYFNNKHESFKTKTLVEQIRFVEHIIVESEPDALLLENNLIKKFQPKYNVLLKDDKTFPWICIKKEPFPRVFSTRKMIKDGSEYFGPYTSALMVRTLLSLIRQLYQLRTCNYNLTEENIKNKKFRKCLEFHIGNCKAPCEMLQTRTDYDISINLIKHILKGNISEVINYLKSLMHEMASNFKFEEAEKIKQKIILLERYKSKSTIVNPKIDNIDVFSIYDTEKSAWINFLKIINGGIVQSHNVEIIKKLDESREDILMFGILDIREKVKSTSCEVIVPFLPTTGLKDMKFIVPQAGDKKRLLELSYRNACQAFELKQRAIDESGYFYKNDLILEKAKKDLQLFELPVHIECFDNSNIQGTSPVAACVVFRKGKPARSEYRHFNIKTVQGPNDFASMEEIIYRRYSRLINEEAELPQLIIIDGGKGQLSAAVNSLQKLNLYGKIPLIGIAKKLEEIYFPNDSIPIYLDKTSTTLKLIQQMRDETHRFGITFHRNKRSKTMLQNRLEQIKGIGPKTAEIIIKKFGSIETLEKTDVKVIRETLGDRIAALLKTELELKTQIPD